MSGYCSLAERKIVSLIHDGQWSVDDNGFIWRVCSRTGLKKGGSHLVRCDRRRVENRTPRGYLQVRATIGGKRLHVGAHRVVWQYLRGDIPLGYEINHENGIKHDNRIENLSCVTASENMKHAHATGLVDQFGERNPKAKLSNELVARIRLDYFQGGLTQAQIAKRLGVAHQTISKIVKGERRSRQDGPLAVDDMRYAGPKDPITGRFVKKAAPHVSLDGIEHNGFPK